METNEVYLVRHHGDEHSSVIGAFSTHQLADDYVTKYRKVYDPNNEEFITIDPFQLDKFVEDKVVQVFMVDVLGDLTVDYNEAHFLFESEMLAHPYYKVECYINTVDKTARFHAQSLVSAEDALTDAMNAAKEWRLVAQRLELPCA